MSEAYLTWKRPGHPIAPPSGIVMAHRIVLFDKLGAGPHPCHWCGKSLPWRGRPSERINADHLDEDIRNNDPDNLVPSCLDCNTKRTLSRIPPKPAAHGTHAGYMWHYRHGIKACKPCRKANAEHVRAWREARAGRAS